MIATIQPRIKTMNNILAGICTGILALSWVVPALADGPQNDPSQQDPYIWLEKKDSTEAMQWVKVENDKTLAVLEKDSHFDGFYKDALAIAQASDRIPMPALLDGQVYNFWQDNDHVKGIWRHASLKNFDSAAPTWITALDLDALSKQENANWVWKGADCEPVAEHRCMLGLSDGGEDALTWREFDLKTGQFVKDGFVLPRGKTRVTWEDKDTLLVAREWNPGELTVSGYPFVVKRLKRGQALDAAQEVFRGKADDGGYGVDLSSLHDATGEQAVIITRPISTFEFEDYLVTKKGTVKLALPLKSSVVGMIKGRVLVKLEQDWKTGDGAFGQGSLVALDLHASERHPDQLKPALVYSPGPRDSIQEVDTSRDAVIVTTLENVRGRVALYRPQPNGRWSSTTLSLPDNSTISIASADWHATTVFLDITGFLQPSSLWQFDSKKTAVEKIKEVSPKFDASHVAVQQFEATSSDGVKIPYFVIGPKDIKLDGNNPTILYGYGGFQISMTPYYEAITGKLWLERGGVFVVSNIRGGGEFGPAWHEAGLKTHRQIIYDDFTSIARDLVARKITSAKHLGIEGGSNGGLLMGVEFTQNPELFNAVDLQVPLLDMLRFEKIAAGTSWVGEYGSVENPEERAFLASISPYANVKKGVQYPEPFIWTTTKDDRVGPQHARKFAARLAEYGIPYLFYEVIEGGHGAGANLKEKAQTNALEMTYFTRRLMDN
jgi:prolyl oligopeptidase